MGCSKWEFAGFEMTERLVMREEMTSGDAGVMCSLGCRPWSARLDQHALGLQIARRVCRERTFSPPSRMTGMPWDGRDSGDCGVIHGCDDWPQDTRSGLDMPSSGRFESTTEASWDEDADGSAALAGTEELPPRRANVSQVGELLVRLSPGEGSTGQDVQVSCRALSGNTKTGSIVK